MKKKELFDFEYVDDNEETKVLHFAFIIPTRAILQKARLEHNKAFADSLKSGAILRSTLNKYMEDQGLWDENREKKYRELFQNLDDGEKKLSKGGIKLKEARKIAIGMRSIRQELQQLLAERTNLDAYTAEGQAENIRFNALFAQCFVDNETGKPYFKNLEDYLEKAGEDFAVAAAEKFASLQFGFSENYEATLVENQFLKKWGFIDDNLRLINKDGCKVNEDGQLIDNWGRLINEDKKLIDVDGSPIDEEGNYDFKFEPFLDDDDNPIVVEKEVEEVKEDKEE